MAAVNSNNNHNNIALLPAIINEFSGDMDKMNTLESKPSRLCCKQYGYHDVT